MNPIESQSIEGLAELAADAKSGFAAVKERYGTKRCQQCGKSLNEDSLYWITSSAERTDTFTCSLCYRRKGIEDFLATGELTSSLLQAAAMYQFHLEEGCINRLPNPEIREYYSRYGHVLACIAADNDDIQAVTVMLLREWVQPVLQPYYRNATQRGHAAKGDGFDALLWGSAGRVLLTIRDSLPQGEGRFNGGWITLIFPECGDALRGGVQGLAATKGEALALLNEAMRQRPAMQPQEEVTLAGL